MDTTTLLILGGLAVVVVVAVLFALNRSWGNFPDRAGQLPPVGPSAPGASALAGLGSLEPELEPPQQLADAPEMPLAGGLVPIEHPLVRRAAEQALLKGVPMAKFIVRSGEQLYFSFDQISDPQQRQAAYELMRRFQAGQDVDIQALMRLINWLSKG